MAKNKIITTGIGVLCVGGILAGALLIPNNTEAEKETYAAIIERNFEQMNEVQDEKTVLSSNPYDYIDNENYDNIVELGFEAVEILQDKGTKEFSGLNAYIASIAIEDITGMDLYEVTGVDYETPEEFYELWDETMKSLPKEMASIVDNSESSCDEKISQLESYGIFAEAFCKDITNDKENKAEFHGIVLDEKIGDELKKDMQELIHTDEKILKSVDAYMEDYME